MAKVEEGKSDVVETSKLKREECKRTKHDSIFSQWKLLVGPCDWEDYLLKKEGAERYRTQNLPNCSSCSGLYELGVAMLPQSRRASSSKLSSKDIVVVYLGQADNVRTRLQQYGREGAHLENGCLSGTLSDCKKQGLFSETFSRGYAIVYRWAPMKSKEDAEITEALLLDTFDYAWNKGMNGARRPRDIHQKLDHIISRKTPKNIVTKLHIFRPREVGLRINSCEPLLMENASSFYSKQDGKHILSRIFKFGRSRHIVVSKELIMNEDDSNVCGVALGRGSTCLMPPIKGNKRCSDHKGMKVNGSIPKLITQGTSNNDTSEGSYFIDNPKGFYPTSEVTLEDDSSCKRNPAACNKGHNGRGVKESVSSPVLVQDNHYAYGPVLFQTPSFNNSFDTICGVKLENGEICTSKPVLGRKRCEEHKGMKVAQNNSKFSGEIPSLFANSGNIPSLYVDSGISISTEWQSPTCKAITLKNSSCQNKPCKGSEFCGKHKLTGFNGSSRNTSCNGSTYSVRTSGTSSYMRDDKGNSSLTCGAATGSGNFCRRNAGVDGKWCWQHERMMVGTYTRESSSYSSTCGAPTRSGSFCSRRTVNGRRCFQH